MSCLSCLIPIAAAIGIGATAMGSTDDKHKTWKKYLYYGGIVSLVIAFLVLMYMIYRGKKKCNTCKG
jgi:uncharacterized membrane protein YsdA (DUF1294 family)